MQNIDQIKIAEEILRTGGLSPHDLAELKTKLAAEYSFILGQLEIVLITKATSWPILRLVAKSDKQADRAFDATDEWKDEIGLKLRAKRIERLLGANSSPLRLYGEESKKFK